MYKQQLTFAELNFGLTLESYLKEITDKKMTILTTAEHRHVRWNRYNVRKPAQHFDHMDSQQKKVDF